MVAKMAMQAYAAPVPAPTTPMLSIFIAILFPGKN